MMERAGWASTKREGSHGKCDKGRASTFGVIAGLAGLEHVISEILQGSVVPNGIMFESWPNSEFLRILAVEISIEYTNGLSADDSLDGFDPGDLLTTCNFPCNGEASVVLVIRAGDGTSLEFYQPSSEGDLWKVTKNVGDLAEP